MRNADRGFGFIDLLPARARGAEQIDADVLVFDLYFHVFRVGQNRHRDGGSVNAPLRFGFGHALHAVHAAFVFKQFIGAPAAHVDNRLFHAA